MFIRIKKISGKSYFYLVESTRVNGKVMQRVIEYIGNSSSLASRVMHEVKK